MPKVYGEPRKVSFKDLNDNVKADHEFFQMDFSDLQVLIEKLKLFESELHREILIDAMHEAAEMITAEQKRLISGTSERLAEHIRYDGVGVMYKHYYSIKDGKITKGVVYIRCGYLEDDWETDADGFNPGLIGTMFEFGRPGQSDDSRRQSKTMKQVRNGKEVTVSKGEIQPVPHIRRGFDNVKDQAVLMVIESVMNALDHIRD